MIDKVICDNVWFVLAHLSVLKSPPSSHGTDPAY